MTTQASAGNSLLRESIAQSPFLSAYIEAMFFTDGSDKDCSLFGATVDDFSYELTRNTIRDCAIFLELAGDLLISENLDRCTGDPVRQAGHDFWLTRNGHGAGFWDGDWERKVGEKLTRFSTVFGGVEPYIGDDGKVYA